jgi:hypothetical protein
MSKTTTDLMAVFMTFLHLRADADDTMSPPIDREEHGSVGVIRA